VIILKSFSEKDIYKLAKYSQSGTYYIVSIYTNDNT